MQSKFRIVSIIIINFNPPSALRGLNWPYTVLCCAICCHGSKSLGSSAQSAPLRQPELTTNTTATRQYTNLTPTIIVVSHTLHTLAVEIKAKHLVSTIYMLLGNVQYAWGGSAYHLGTWRCAMGTRILFRWRTTINCQVIVYLIVNTFYTYITCVGHSKLVRPHSCVGWK